MDAYRELAQRWQAQAALWLAASAGEVSAADVDALRRKVAEVWQDCARELLEAVELDAVEGDW